MNKTIIIAEAGVNHNGDMEIAKKLINVAADSGADYVKFQTFKANEIAIKKSKKAEYQIKNLKNHDSQFEMLKKLELTKKHHLDLIKHCSIKKIKFLSTAFDTNSLEFLKKLDLKIAKIPSGEITNYPYLLSIAKNFKNVIISTGMSNIMEINNALNVLIGNGIKKDNITVLHCNTDYPTNYSDVNLKAMLNIHNKTGLKYGYSDHTLGIEVPIAAVALGASVIEKHFTISRTMQGPDHAASLEPDELKNMIKSIRNIELSISGNGLKQPSKSELKNKEIVRKSIVAIKKINKNEIFTPYNIGIKRPGTGISPMKWNQIIGTYAIKDFEVDDMIEI
tara:strand:- start:6579 stop:7586 length:1008 start_codon:yes stop_codon:yes gene_type:complete